MASPSDFVGVSVGFSFQEAYGSALGFLELLIGVRCSAIHAPILDTLGVANPVYYVLFGTCDVF